MKHFVIHKYPNGQIITVEWSVEFDGPWVQKTDDITVEHKENLYPD